MKNNLIFTTLLLKIVTSMLFLGSIAASCNKDKEPDPCASATPFKATFDILEEVGDTLIATDTAVANNRVFFKAPKGYDSYAWYVDDLKMDNFYIQKDPTQFFLGFMYPAKDVKITLVAKKKPLTTCFPTDDGIDSITKYLQVRDILETPIKGKYFGYYKSNPKDTATVEIKVDFVISDYYIAISNINKGCNTELRRYVFSYPNVTWKGFYVNGQDIYSNRLQCFAPIIKATLSSNYQDLTVNFSYAPDIKQLEKRTYDTFIGKRVK
jgi:hypothetical protein